jgi:hypothetical protein
METKAYIAPAIYDRGRVLSSTLGANGDSDEAGLSVNKTTPNSGTTNPDND